MLEKMKNKKLWLDIESELKRLTDLNTRKSDHIEMMAHELKTPLTILKSALEALSQNWVPAPEHRERLVEVCNRAVVRLIRLVEDHLDLAKIESGKIHYRIESIDVHHAVSHVVHAFHTQAHQKGIQLDNELLPELPNVKADEDRLIQILTNLVYNAIKFTPTGGTIAISAVPKDEFLEISVRDTGIGISEEDQKIIFEKYRQGKNVVTIPNKEGAGLGLSIVKGLLEAHGGTISVVSTPNHGSTFTFTLPIYRDV